MRADRLVLLAKSWRSIPRGAGSATLCNSACTAPFKCSANSKATERNRVLVGHCVCHRSHRLSVVNAFATARRWGRLSVASASKVDDELLVYRHLAPIVKQCQRTILPADCWRARSASAASDSPTPGRSSSASSPRMIVNRALPALRFFLSASVSLPFAIGPIAANFVGERISRHSRMPALSRSIVQQCAPRSARVIMRRSNVRMRNFYRLRVVLESAARLVAAANLSAAAGRSRAASQNTGPRCASRIQFFG